MLDSTITCVLYLIRTTLLVLSDLNYVGFAVFNWPVDSIGLSYFDIRTYMVEVIISKIVLCYNSPC